MLMICKLFQDNLGVLQEALIKYQKSFGYSPEFSKCEASTMEKLLHFIDERFADDFFTNG